jgi:hypothetical protein
MWNVIRFNVQANRRQMNIKHEWQMTQSDSVIYFHVIAGSSDMHRPNPLFILKLFLYLYQIPLNCFWYSQIDFLCHGDINELTASTWPF